MSVMATNLPATKRLPWAKMLKRAIWGAYLLLIAVFLALPAVLVVISSFDAADYMQFPPKELTLKWFATVLQSDTMQLAILNSIIVGAVTTIICVLLAVPAALVIVRRQFPGRDTLFALLMSPIAVPWVVFGLAMLYLWSALSWQRDLSTIILGHTVMGVPYVLRTCVAVLGGVSPSYELAARTLGADRWRSFVLVTLPMMRSGIIAGAVFCLLLSFINVPVPLFLTTSSSTTIQVAIFSYLLSNYDPGVAAISTIQLVIILLSLYVAQRLANVREFIL